MMILMKNSITLLWHSVCSGRLSAPRLGKADGAQGRKKSRKASWPHTHSDEDFLKSGMSTQHADLYPPGSERRHELRNACRSALISWFNATGWTQARAAVVLGLSPSRMSALMNGADQFSLDALVSMASAAGLDVKISLTCEPLPAVQ